MKKPPIVPAEFKFLLSDFAQHVTRSIRYFEQARLQPPSSTLDPRTLGSLISTLIEAQASYAKSQAEAQVSLTALSSASKAWPYAKKSLHLLRKSTEAWLRLINNSISANKTLLAAKDPRTVMPKLESLWMRNRLLAARSESEFRRGMALLAEETGNAVTAETILDD